VWATGHSAGAATVTLRGGTISENERCGVEVWGGAEVTVASAEKDGLPQTVSNDNNRHDWHAVDGGVIIGTPQEQLNVDNSQ